MTVQDRTRLHFEDWPLADQAAWERARKPAGPFDLEAGRATRWRPTTQALYEQGYGYWLGWLKSIGRLDASALPAERATFEAVSAYLGMLQSSTAAMTQAGRIQHLGEVLRAMAPEGDWRWILRAAWRIQSEAIPVRDISARLRSPEEVLTLGLDLMYAAEFDRFRTEHDRGKLYRDGLILALLCHRPIRRANLAAIHIGQQLRQCGDRWRVSFTAAEMKNGRPYQFEWPETLQAALERYLDVFRPGLLAGAKEPEGPKALWVSRRAQAMTPCALSIQISDRTEAEFGLAINLHSFRHIAATTMATNAPAEIFDSARLLGHTRLAMTTKHYNRAGMLEAGRSYQETILARREEG